MKHSLIPLHDSDKWNAALEGMPYTVFHSPAYCRALSMSLDWDVFLYCGEDGEHRLICPLAVRMLTEEAPELFSPYGFGGFLSSFPASKNEEIFEKWSAFCRSEGIVTAYVVQHPAFDGIAPLFDSMARQPQSVYLLDTTAPIQALRANIDKTHRYEINRIERSTEVDIINDDTKLHAAFLRLYPETIRRVGASGAYDFSPETLNAFLNLPETLAIGAETASGIQAVSLFFLPSSDNGVMEYFLSASTTEGRAFSRNLLWKAVELHHERGGICLNLGGGVSPGDGLDNFKRRFNGKRVPLTALKQVVNTDRYETLCRTYGVAAHTKDGYFPPYWQGRSSIKPLQQNEATND